MAKWLAGAILLALASCAPLSSGNAELDKLLRVSFAIQHEAVARSWCSNPCASTTMSQAPSLSATMTMPGRDMVVTQTMVDYTQSDDELAFIIAHELAHLMLGTQSTRGVELAADALGIELVILAGYDPQGGISLLTRLGSEFEWANVGFYPSFAERVRIIESVMLTLKETP